MKIQQLQRVKVLALFMFASANCSRGGAVRQNRAPLVRTRRWPDIHIDKKRASYVSRYLGVSQLSFAGGAPSPADSEKIA